MAGLPLPSLRVPPPPVLPAPPFIPTFAGIYSIWYVKGDYPNFIDLVDLFSFETLLFFKYLVHIPLYTNM